MATIRQAVSVLLCPALILSSIGLDGCKKDSKSQQEESQAPAVTYAAPTAEQLYQLVAPIALFPDNLVAQVLAASTYPDQVTEAWNWLQQNKALQGQQLMESVNQQSWDVSVKGLTQFSDVLQQMAGNLSWTSALGDAYFNSPQNVMNAVQVMRQRAYQAGNLKTTPQQNVSVQNEAPAAQPAQASSGQQQVTVVQAPPQTIVIQPSQPNVVYVPTYNPTYVYGAPVAPYPGYSTAALVTTGLISFGVGMMVGAAMNNSCCGWGWNSWGCGWHSSSVTYNRNVYISNSNTFVNRNNYYNRNNVNINNANINRNNINTNDINRNNFNRNNVNTNDINRNNVNRNNANRNNMNRGGDFGSTPHFDQKLNQPKFQEQNRAGNATAPRISSQPAVNQRATTARNQPSQPAFGQNDRQPVRGYGDQSSNRPHSNNAMANYGQGGNARANSARGQQSFNAGAANRGGQSNAPARANNVPARSPAAGAANRGGAAARERHGRR
jgi:hypothetical protein